MTNNTTRYSITVPLADNDGESLSDVHAYVRMTLSIAFGGFTELAGNGYWSGEHSGRESVCIYLVDTDSVSAPDVFRNLALIVKRDARQDAVYLTTQSILTALI